jgi:hypothetical protein
MLFVASRGLPVLIELGLLIFALVDCIQTPQEEQRNLPKVGWLLLILLLPLIGSIAWLLAGRPQRGRRRDVPWPSTRTAGFPEYERPGRRPYGAPDDDPAFLAGIGPDPEKERLLAQWEADLKRREERLRKGPDAGPPAEGDGAPPAKP